MGSIYMNIMFYKYHTCIFNLDKLYILGDAHVAIIYKCDFQDSIKNVTLTCYSYLVINGNQVYIEHNNAWNMIIHLKYLSSEQTQLILIRSIDVIPIQCFNNV